MTAAEDRELRDRIDVFSDRESKCSHSVELAKSNYAASKAAYEVRLEAPDTREMELRARHQRTAQVVLSIALPLMFVGSGVPPCGAWARDLEPVVHGAWLGFGRHGGLSRCGGARDAVPPEQGAGSAKGRASKARNGSCCRIRRNTSRALPSRRRSRGDSRVSRESRAGRGLIELAPCTDDSRRGEGRSR